MPVVTADVPTIEIKPPSAALVERDATKETDRYAGSMFRPKRTGQVKIADIRQAYRGWCNELELDPLPDPEIGRALSVLFSSVGLHRHGEGADPDHGHRLTAPNPPHGQETIA